MSAVVPQTIRANPAGNVLQRQISNGRGSATSMGNTLGGDFRMSDVRSGLESASSLGGASSSSAEAAQELSEKLWQALMEGVQPFMQWELQSGMGDFWEQVCLQVMTSCRGSELLMLFASEHTLQYRSSYPLLYMVKPDMSIGQLGKPEVTGIKLLHMCTSNQALQCFRFDSMRTAIIAMH